MARSVLNAGIPHPGGMTAGSRAVGARSGDPRITRTSEDCIPEGCQNPLKVHHARQKLPSSGPPSGVPNSSWLVTGGLRSAVRPPGFHPSGMRNCEALSTYSAFSGRKAIGRTLVE